MAENIVNLQKSKNHNLYYHNTLNGSSYAYNYEGSADKENVRLTSVIHKAAGDGGEITYRYDYSRGDAPKLNIIKEAEGNRYTVSYDSKGRAEEMADPEGKAQRLTYSKDAAETKTETIIKTGLFSRETISEETDRFDSWFGNCIESIDAAGERTGYTKPSHMIPKAETL